jgi:phosphate-selective porin OprO/OprP
MERSWHICIPAVVKPLAFTLVLAALSLAPLRAQEMTWTPRPSLRLGDVAKIDPRVKVQGDFRWFPAELEPDSGAFAWGLRRVGVEGGLLDHIAFEIEHDFDDGGEWTDVFVDVRLDYVQVQAGRFKIPFSLDELTGSTSNDFVNRSILGRDLAPGRGVGVVLHGEALKQAAGITYDAGFFRDDGERAEIAGNPDSGATFAGRFGIRPLFDLRADAPLRTMTVGFNITVNDVPAGAVPNALRANTIAGDGILAPVHVAGQRTRIGADALWEPGPFSLRAEFMRASDERRGQGPGRENLPGLDVASWYVAGAWVLTGEEKAGGVNPSAALFNGGIGAVELALRYEQLRADGGRPAAPGSLDPRSASLVEVRTAATTLGVNWYLNRWSKLQFNAIRESFGSAVHSPVAGRAAFWSGAGRLQFIL